MSTDDLVLLYSNAIIIHFDNTYFLFALLRHKINVYIYCINIVCLLYQIDIS